MLHEVPSVQGAFVGKLREELEFLWPKSPDNAIFRRPDNKKWYAVLLTVQKEKLGHHLSGRHGGY